MNLRRIFICLPLVSLLIMNSITYASAHQDLQSEVVEKALLQQLKPVIMNSLQKIYNEKYSQFNCERVLSINERFTIKKAKDKATPVDAIHGAQYFEIWIDLCRPDGDRVQILLKNDGHNGGYQIITYKIVETP